MHRPTVDAYDARGSRWARTHRRAHRRADARSFATAVSTGAPRVDLGCGAGRYAPHLGRPLVGLDASPAMLAACAARAPQARLVLGDVEALPFATGALAGAWSAMTHHHLPRERVPLALWDLHRACAVGAPLDLQVLAGEHAGPAPDGDEVPGRYFAAWQAEALVDVLVGAGFDATPDSIVASGDELSVRSRRRWTLADTVGPSMRLLVCGLNPSPAAAEAGVGFAGPTNRFWPAARAAGIVSRDRDPRHALVAHGVGMTDLVKRTTPRAAELAPAEYAAGLGRLERLVAWLRPGALCVVGLAGWRSALDHRAVPGVQLRRLAGAPVYLMPSTSGLNASSRFEDLVAHLQAAAALARRGAAGPVLSP